MEWLSQTDTLLARLKNPTGEGLIEINSKNRTRMTTLLSFK
jgi:hypothetical protein